MPNPMDEFTKGYIECALWSSLDQSDPDTGGRPFTDNYDIDDIAPDTLARMVDDCASFQRDNCAELLTYTTTYSDARAGHDFWLTRNRHGAGFWDGSDMDATRSALTDAARAAGECDLYLGDDNKIHAG